MLLEFKDFVDFIFQYYYKKKFIWKEFHFRIVHALIRVLLGRTTRLIINMPPRYGKTELIKLFIAWTFGAYPQSRYIYTCYSARLAGTITQQIRDVCGSEQFHQIYKNFFLSADCRAKNNFGSSELGGVYSDGSGGSLTGIGAGALSDKFSGFIAVDDPIKPLDAAAKSRVALENVIEWFQGTLQSRVNSPSTPIIVIMQRLHQRDLSGWIIDGGDDEEWEHVKIPVFDSNNDPIWTEKHNRQKLEKMQEKNPYVFSGQYMQRPTPKSGGIVKKSWVKRYEVAPAEYVRIIQSLDTAYKASKLNDPSVITTWLETDLGRYYLIDVFRFRAEYPELKRHVKSKYAEFNPSAVLIEDKSSGQSLIQELREETGIEVIPIMPCGDKETRMSTASSVYEAGLVYHPESAPWLPAFESELFTFPLSSHDDQVDSTSQLLNWVKQPQEIFIG